MGAGKFYGSAGFDCAVETDEIVVADAVPTTCPVPGVDFSDGDVAMAGSGGAVDDDFVDVAHNLGYMYRLKFVAGQR